MCWGPYFHVNCTINAQSLWFCSSALQLYLCCLPGVLFAVNLWCWLSSLPMSGILVKQSKTVQVWLFGLYWLQKKCSSKLIRYIFLHSYLLPAKCHLQHLNRKVVFHQLVEGTRLVEPSIWVCLIVYTHNTTEKPNTLPANLPFPGLHLI